jgi:PPM family protein phosphatase
MSLGRSAARSDPGRKRLRNEDAYVCEPPLFAVADGMGGAQAGELASNLAAAALRERPADAFSEERVADLLREANRRVYERASEDAAASGMGTTVTAALVEGDRVVIGHVGDSRAYLIRDGELVQVTDDHSLVAELVRSGRLSPEEADSHPQRSVITRALGTDPEVDVDTFSIDAQPGDLFLICSDGLSSMVRNSTILEVAERHRDDLDAAARALLGAANRGGGEDNITVVLFEIAQDAEPAEQGVDAAEPAAEAGELGEADTLTELDAVPVVRPEEAPAEVAPAEAAEAEEPQAEVAEAEEPQAEEAQAEEPPAEEHRAEAQAGLFHKLLALVLIAGLSALIVALVLWGLAR